MRNGVTSLLVAFAFSGYGFFRYPERPVFGVVLMVVGLLNVFVCGASFGLAIWGDR
jgi:cation transporter-like permease